MKHKVVVLAILLSYSIILVLCGYVMGSELRRKDVLEVNIKLEAQEFIDYGIDYGIDNYNNTDNNTDNGTEGLRWY